jgi:hypothetical protein
VANLDKDLWIVVTTVQSPTPALRALLAHCAGWQIVVVGDSKTPDDWEQVPGIHWLSLARQSEEFPALAQALPLGHYSRKNLGYLYAIRRGAGWILETDDDNEPREGFGDVPELVLEGRAIGGRGWFNPYLHFGRGDVWPRGLPLDALWQPGRVLAHRARAECPVQQFLVDGDPDVDAIFRLVHRGRSIRFAANPPLLVEPGTWAPFNSQNTLFHAGAFPTLYLPHECSFRMTDIWRSLVAQSSLWAHGHRIAFRGPTAWQARNAHSLLQDFAEEVPGYLCNRRIAGRLATARRDGDESLATTVHRLWRLLIDDGHLPEREQVLLDLWFAELAAGVAA